MKFMQVVSLEQASQAWAFASNPDQQTGTYQSELAWIEDNLLRGGNVARGLRERGWSTSVVVANSWRLQERWAFENGREALLKSPRWLQEVLEEQVRDFAPDILHVADEGLASSFRNAAVGRFNGVVLGPDISGEAAGGGHRLLTRESETLWRVHDQSIVQEPVFAPGDMVDGVSDIAFFGTLDSANSRLMTCLEQLATAADQRFKLAFFIRIEPGLRVPDAIARVARPIPWGNRRLWQLRGARAVLFAADTGVAHEAELGYRAGHGEAVYLAEPGAPGAIKARAAGFVVEGDPEVAVARLLRIADEAGGVNGQGAPASKSGMSRADQWDLELRRILGVDEELRAEHLAASTSRGDGVVGRIADLWRDRQPGIEDALSQIELEEDAGAGVYAVRGDVARANDQGDVVSAPTPDMAPALHLDHVDQAMPTDEQLRVLEDQVASTPVGSTDQLRAASILRQARGPEWLVVLGIDEEDPGGTGRWVKSLREHLPPLVPGIRFYRSADLGNAVVDEVLERQARTDAEIILVHPQVMGFARANAIILGASKPVWIYLLDSSYFCVRSYNWRPGPHRPCLDCIGGDFDKQVEHNCVPFPIVEEAAMAYTRILHMHARTGRVRFLAQNHTQAGLARRHFGDGADVRVTGLWTEDIESVMPGGVVSPDLGNQPMGQGPIVFHGWHLDPKGMGWTLDVAEQCPEYQFLFPFADGMTERPAPENCIFEPITWDTGLRERILEARLTLVPSVWSAPIENSLVKSIVVSSGVGVVQNPTSFSNEIPDSVIMKLSEDPMEASRQLRANLEAGWRPAPEELTRWVDGFVERNHGMIGNMVSVVNQEALASPPDA